MLTAEVALNFCCKVETTTDWPCCNWVAVTDALLCWLRNCCMKPDTVPLYGVAADPIPVCAPKVNCAELRHDRRHAAGKIHTDHLIVRIGGRGVRQRERGWIVDAQDRDLVLGAGRGVRIGQVDAVAELHGRQVEIETGRWPRHRRTGL